MKHLYHLLLALSVLAAIAVIPAFSQNSPPDSLPNPSIIGSFTPDSSCLDKGENPRGGTADRPLVFSLGIPGSWRVPQGLKCIRDFPILPAP